MSIHLPTLEGRTRERQNIADLIGLIVAGDPELAQRHNAADGSGAGVVGGGVQRV
jgi:hypothetical protein